jgi:hypothetical protein
MAVKIDLNGAFKGKDNTTDLNGNGLLAPDATVTNPNNINTIEFSISGKDAKDITLALSSSAPTGYTIIATAPDTYTLTYIGGSPDWQAALQAVTISDSHAPHNTLDTTVATITVQALNAHGHDIGAARTDDVICFLAGTQISTPFGYRNIETLQIGDEVLTAEGESRPVRWLGIQTVSRYFADPLRSFPVRVKANAIADNVPSRDLLVSPDHALMVDGALVQAGALVNGTSIVREQNLPATFKYYHVELADHALILAENTPAETFIDNVDRLGFDNWAEHEALYGAAEPLVEMGFSRAKSTRQVPVATRVRLATRGDALYARKSGAAA